MSGKFSVTLVALEADGSRANAELGENRLGDVPAEELQQLLERFRVIDPIELVTADPEIIIENRRSKFVVRAGEGKLYLQDKSKFDDPTLALTSAEILAELDGSAKADRIRRANEAKEREVAALAAEREAQPIIVPVVQQPPSALGASHRAGLAAVAACLLGYIGFSLWPSAGAAESELNFELLTDAKEVTRLRTEVVGVYMTGSQPGDHGIALTADGAVRFFTL